MENFLRFNKSDLFSYAVRYMEKLGIPENDAKIVADVLIEAD
ncbi:MAG: Ldh family oxidoreductase, partial [Actinobacteria bacterium]|nr:Ldh family oxidoreductase [Actinomycetota bacterium]